VSLYLVERKRVTVERLNLGGVKVELLFHEVVVVGAVDLDVEGVFGRRDVIGLHLRERSMVTQCHGEWEQGVLGALPLLGCDNVLAHL
jgi:hypothetical protein